MFSSALNTYADDGTPQYNLVLSGKAKKNNKTTDAVLATFYLFFARQSAQGNDCSLLANDSDQRLMILALAKKVDRGQCSAKP